MAEFRRKFYDWLLQWKSTKQHECLLVKGARQIGKTFIIEKFGREQYESFIEFNFIDHDCLADALRAEGIEPVVIANAAKAGRIHEALKDAVETAIRL